MRRPIIVLVILLIPFILSAQETGKQREAGLIFSSFNNFGLTYRVGTSSSVWRFNTSFLSGGSTTQSSSTYENINTSLGFEISVGNEFRKSVTENLELRYGLDLSFGYSRAKSDVDDKTYVDNDYVSTQEQITPGINLVLGFNYLLKNNLVLGVEFLPYFKYVSNTSEYSFVNPVSETISTYKGFLYGLNNNSARLSLIYRF